MITTLRFTPTWLVPFQLFSPGTERTSRSQQPHPLRARAIGVGTALVAGLFVLAGCGDKTPKQANAKEPEPTPAVSVTATSAPVGPVSFEAAESSFHARRYDEAVSGFESYTSSRPTNPFGFYMLGLSAWKSGDLARAEDALRQALALDSTHVKSYLNLSRVLLDAGQPDTALGTLDAVLRIDEALGEAYRLIGRAHDAKGEPDQAVTAYHEALVLDSTDVWSMNNLGLVLIHQGAFEDALRPLARAVDLSPEVVTFQNNLGMALERTGHFTASADAYRAAITADSGFTKAQTNLERVSGLKEDPNVARIDLKVLSQGFNAEISGWATEEK